MKIYITIFLVTLLIGISCSDNRTVEDDLAGEWVYERESFISSSTLEDPDTRGIMIFNSDETGTWISDNGSNFGTEIEWDLQRMDSKISITKIFPEQFGLFGFSQIYDINQSGEDNFTFTFEVKIESLIDSIESFSRFENIILTRK